MVIDGPAPRVGQSFLVTRSCLLLVCALAARAAAAPAADLIVVWTPGADPQPIATVARELGAALIDRSPARPAASPVAPLLRAGIDAYEALELDDAWSQLERATAAVDREGGAELTATQLSDLLLDRALVRTERGDAQGAWDELVAAAVIDPARVFDPARFSPKVIELAIRARTETLAQPRATLAITTPPGCRISLDGRRYEPAALLLAGPHWARVECVDHESWGARVVVTAPSTELVARPRPFAPPTDVDVLVQARTAGARAVIVAELRGGIGTARLVGSDGREHARRSVAITGDLSPLAAAIRALDPPDVVARPRWYHSRWVWAAGAAALAAAILIPTTAILAGDDRPRDAVITAPEFRR
jgi:hypothetical protein